MIPEEELNTISIVNPYEKDLTATTFYISKRKKKKLTLVMRYKNWIVQDVLYVWG